MDLKTFLFISFCAAALISFWFFWKKEDGKSLVFLILAAFAIRFFMISLDPFLYEWDERFHALVAKNMMTHPFKPMLRVSLLLPYQFDNWCCNHVWLHKQPLFMWQMALSMKLFGVNEVALRLPNALMGAILVWPTFRIGKLLIQRETGYFGAILFAFAFYQLELTSGAFGMDHNDIGFMFYTVLSLWAYFEYDLKLQKGQRSYKWLILIGIFAGCAVLCKWLTGLLVFGGWGLSILTVAEKRKSLRNYLDAAIAFAISILIFMPWQLYTAWRFPAESKFERDYNSRHVFEVIEGHGGTETFYIEKLNLQYGYGYSVLIFIGLVVAIMLIPKRNKVAFLSFILAPYIFFSLVAKTKLTGYTYFIAPLIYLLIGSVIFSLTQFLGDAKGNKRLLLPTVLILLICLLTTLRYPEIVRFHLKNDKSEYHFVQREAKINNATIYRQLNKLVPKEYTVFNTRKHEEIEAMFYSDRNVYSFIPGEEDYQALKKRGVMMAFFKDHTDRVLPDYIKNDPTVLIIDQTLY